MDLHPLLMYRCAVCSAMCPKRLACGRCKLATYCSAACQRALWSHHTCMPPEERASAEEQARHRAAQRLKQLVCSGPL